MRLETKYRDGEYKIEVVTQDRGNHYLTVNKLFVGRSCEKMNSVTSDTLDKAIETHFEEAEGLIKIIPKKS